MHFQTSTGNSSGPTTLPSSILLSAFYTSSLLTQFTSSLTTSASSVLRTLLFSSFISFAKYSFHLFNNPSEFIITFPFSSFITLTCCTSFPAPSLCLANLYNFISLSFVSNQAYKSSYACSFAIATTFFALLFFFLYIFLVFSSLILSHAFFFYALLNFLISSPCLPVFFLFPKCHSQNSLRCFFSILLFCPTHHVTHDCLPESWSSLV